MGVLGPVAPASVPPAAETMGSFASLEILDCVKASDESKTLDTWISLRVRKAQLQTAVKLRGETGQDPLELRETPGQQT